VEGSHCCRQVWLAGARGILAPGAAGVQAAPHRQLNVRNPVLLGCRSCLLLLLCNGANGCCGVSWWRTAHDHHLVAQLRQGPRLHSAGSSGGSRSVRSGGGGGGGGRQPAAGDRRRPAAPNYLAAGVHSIPAECPCVEFDRQQQQPHVFEFVTEDQFTERLFTRAMPLW
jgi:hypothetical protein